ncbi:MAG: 3-phosphoshikimate 1-carboxyvinyltransferase, partial [Lachnospiraceae bacterium]|nr:3-phosphoshikimate 1-carboxyvinyltransferase [Lachnospiraceae bacterium]
QFITGLLLTLPLVEGDSCLTVTGKFESASYVDLTISAMQKFGITVTRKDNIFNIKSGQQYKAAEYTVEGDCSNAAFLDAFNLLGGEVKVLGVDDDTLQGDRVYKEMFEGLKEGERQFELSDCPDLAPVMFAMAAYQGGAKFLGTARLRIKESDRAAVMAEELAKFGIAVEVFDNSVRVHGGELRTPGEVLCGHNDHRIVMALSLLCSVTGGCIEDAQAVTKSFPDFFERIAELGIKVEKQG